jgi:phosphoglycerate dehydrogenase-like enzyme
MGERTLHVRNAAESSGVVLQLGAGGRLGLFQVQGADAGHTIPSRSVGRSLWTGLYRRPYDWGMKHLLIDVPLEDAALVRLRDQPGLEVHLTEPHEPGKFAAEWLRGKHVLLCKKPPENFDDLTDLEFLQLATVGYEHLRNLNFADRPVRVCNARGVFDTAIAEWAVAMMINLTRDLRSMLRNQDNAVWHRADCFQQEARGRVLGLWGYGGIGRETSRLARALGMTVHVLTRSGVGPRHDTFSEPDTGDPDGRLPHRVFTAGQEREFLSGLDFLVLALPHTQKTAGMVGATELRALPRTAFVLNPARGPIIQETALLTALREGWIAGAALDTHFTYPLPPEHPLWAMPHVILTPHISGADHSRNFPARMGELLMQNVERYLSGRPLLNMVTAAEWREA